MKDYGEEGTAFNVRPGDIWQQGRHRFVCGDLEDPQLEDRLPWDDPLVTYTDPPWGPGLATGFRTKAGVPRKVDYDRFLEALFSLLTRTEYDILFEQGIKWQEQTEAAAVRAGISLSQTVPITYNGPNPALLTHGWARRRALEDIEFCRDKDDWWTPGLVLSMLQGLLSVPLTVMDPCLGMGRTAVAAEGLGVACLGIELHPNRLSAAMFRVYKVQGNAPRKVGVIG